MRSPILQEILDETSPETERYVEFYASCVIFKGNIKRKLDSLKVYQRVFNDYQLGRLDALEMVINEFENIVKL